MTNVPSYYTVGDAIVDKWCLIYHDDQWIGPLMLRADPCLYKLSKMIDDAIEEARMDERRGWESWPEMRWLKRWWRKRITE
jgi:hypothetical protein